MAAAQGLGSESSQTLKRLKNPHKSMMKLLVWNLEQTARGDRSSARERSLILERGGHGIWFKHFIEHLKRARKIPPVNGGLRPIQ
ncbi:hypothetical protein H6P81_005766 [Aristolochia fimbriata]|uniref:Uncharacterized protein n=1 Tax=Aristolochia fimbriata TaxID=158543 RepID=A0AAV7EYY4_ARIFI|nr:hypothetical protein H6P81_005766 [Aristolochia fimbriata]